MAKNKNLSQKTAAAGRARKGARPKVSVLTPFYNTNPAVLRQMIESVLNQTFADFEFILLNDSPKNKKLAGLVKSYKDPRIVYLENKSNLGITASRNRLIDLARGEYLAVRDHDDISRPEMFQKQVEYLDANPGVGVVSCNVSYLPRGRPTKCPKDNIEIKRELMHGCAVAHQASMIRKSVLIKSGVRYEPEYSPSEDYMLWIRLIPHTMFHNLPDVLLDYRDDAGNTSHMQDKRMADVTVNILDFAHANHPYLASGKDKEWLRLFFRIPFIKAKRWAGVTKFYLFGFIPLICKR
jgi:glycosyltransferase involved in cell wall biosynthesis